MITLRKLESLKEGTRQRKCILLLKEFEQKLLQGKLPDRLYYKGLCRLVCRDLQQDFFFPEDSQNWLRYGNELRHELLKQMGQEPSDWDFSVSPDRAMERSPLPMRVYLDDIRSPFNLGSIFRTSEALGVEELLLSPGTSSPDHPRAKRTAMGAVDILPHRRLERELLEGPVFALETGGTNLKDFTFPKSGTMILGSEELGVSPELLKLADGSLGRVTIPMRGMKGSLNVAVAYGIVLQTWSSILDL